VSPKFEIVEAKAQHCGQMTRLLRAEHRAAVEALDIDTHRQLRACFDASAFRRAWLVDGKLGALGGVTGGKLDVYGQVWLAFSSVGLRYPKEIIREARKQLAEISQVKRKLVTLMLLSDTPSVRFARHVGFQIVADETENFETAIMQFEGKQSWPSRLWH
jgi:hypothetical protein